MLAADEDRNRVRPPLSAWAAACWGLLGVALLPVAVSQGIEITTPGGFERGNPMMLVPLSPIVCFMESGFHLRRFVLDRKEWDRMAVHPPRSPLWWLIPAPRPMGRSR